MYQLPELSYAYNALEPYIDAQTMEIHHTKHHAAYVNNLNAAIKDTEMESLPLEDLFKNISKHPAAVRNNGGGHFNHSLFWSILIGNKTEPRGELLDKISSAFGSFEGFKEQFAKAGITRFGSGWAWLIVKDSNLVITSTPNQDNPLMDVAEIKGTPILGMDVWEHAYYLKYQNRRPEYIEAFFNVINWDEVTNLYNKATK